MIHLLETNAAQLGYELEFTHIDSGFLFEETLNHKQATAKKYQMRIDTLTPELYGDEFVGVHGKLWETDRIQYLELVKKGPLRAKINRTNPKVWISGLRRQSATSRTDLSCVMWSPHWHLLKVHPIVDWDNRTLGRYMKQHCCDYHPLFGTYTTVGDKHSTLLDCHGNTMRNGGRFRECGLHRAISNEN